MQIKVNDVFYGNDDGCLFQVIKVLSSGKVRIRRIGRKIIKSFPKEYYHLVLPDINNFIRYDDEKGILKEIKYFDDGIPYLSFSCYPYLAHLWDGKELIRSEEWVNV